MGRWLPEPLPRTVAFLADHFTLGNMRSPVGVGVTAGRHLNSYLPSPGTNCLFPAALPVDESVVIPVPLIYSLPLKSLSLAPAVIRSSIVDPCSYNNIKLFGFAGCVLL